MSEVAKVHLLDPKSAAALGFSFQVDLSNGKSIVLQTHLPNDCNADSLNAMLDKLALAGSRQKAREELKQLQKQLKQHRKSLDHQREDATRLDKDFAKEKQAHELRLRTWAEKKDAAGDAARERHDASGRRSPMRELPHNTRNEIRAIDGKVTDAQNAWGERVAKHEADQAGYRTNVSRFEEAIAEIQSDIAECKKILGE